MVSTRQPFSPIHGGWVSSILDALLVFRAAKDGIIPSVSRRLSDVEKVQHIRSGAIFVFEEKFSGIKRWTDSREWSPSRILYNFLIYRELNPNRPDRTSKGTSHAASGSQANARAGQVRRASTGRDENEELLRELVGSLREHADFQLDGLMKKTITITFNAHTPNARAHHIVSYYKAEDVLEGRLLPIHCLPLFQGMEPAHEWLDPKYFRIPPKIELDGYGCRHYVGEADDEPAPVGASRPLVRGVEAGHTPRASSSRYVPYARPTLVSHNSSASVSSAASSSGTATVASTSEHPGEISAARTPPHLPSLSPSSTASTLSVSPTEYAGHAAHPAQHAHFGYYAHAAPYAPYYPSLASASHEMASLAVDHSAAPRPSPYYPAAYSWQSLPSAEVKTEAVDQVYQQMQQQQMMYGMYPHPGEGAYAYPGQERDYMEYMRMLEEGQEEAPLQDSSGATTPVIRGVDALAE